MSGLRLHRPGDLNEVVALLDGLGRGACLLAGGVEITEQVKKNALAATHLVDLKSVTDLATIEDRGSSLWLGATVTHRQLAVDRSVAVRAPALARAAAALGNARVRALGTLGGNLCASLPLSDVGPVLIAARARALVRSSTGPRWVAVADLLDRQADSGLDPADVLVGIEIPAQARVNGYARFPAVGTPVAVAAAASGRGGAAPSVVVVGCNALGLLPISGLAHELDRATPHPLRAITQGVAAAAATALTDAGADEYHSHLGAVVAARAVSIAISDQEGWR